MKKHVAVATTSDTTDPCPKSSAWCGFGFAAGCAAEAMPRLSDALSVLRYALGVEAKKDGWKENPHLEQFARRCIERHQSNLNRRS